MGMTGDCFQILKICHPHLVDEFRAWRYLSIGEVIDRLRPRFFVDGFTPAGVRDMDCVLWADPIGKAHLSVYEKRQFHMIGKDGTMKRVHLTARWQRTTLRPAHIVREKIS